MGTISVGQATRDRFSTLGDLASLCARASARLRGAHRSGAVLAAEGLLAALSYSVAILLVSPDRGTESAAHILRLTLLPAVAVPLLMSSAMRLHRRSLSQASAVDVISLAKVVSLSSVLFAAVVCLEFPRLGVPVAAFLLFAALLQITWSALHFTPRALRLQKAAKRGSGKRAVIVGAGDAGMAVLKELASDPDSPSRPVSLVDDDPRKWGRTYCGVTVAGTTKDLASIAAAHQAQEILICIPSASRAQMHDILDASRRSNLPVRSLPSITELLRRANCGRVSRHDLCSPRIEDLLQREEIVVEAGETRSLVGKQVVLVTGAGGSIGSELSRQIAAANPERLLLVDKSENSLFYVHRELAERGATACVKPYLVDVTDRERIARIMQAEKPGLVFHAAAYKHVAMLERHPEEAIRNNVLGTRNVADAALACGAARMVNISTDKAVAPRNYMGLSKKITELCVQELSRASGTKLCNVRFGNVAGSTGSVLRLFWDQIQRGGPVRVTDPRASRYFMSISEAVHLILQAAALGETGETFIFEMGAPANIAELARTMMLFAGLRPGIDIGIEYTGLQPGEKLTEELWEAWERPQRTSSERILVIPSQDAEAHGVLTRIARMEDLLARGESVRLVEYLHQSYPLFAANRTLTRACAPGPLTISVPTAKSVANDRDRMVGAA